MWPILLLFACSIRSHYVDEEFGFEVIDRTGCDLKIWSSENESPSVELELPSRRVFQYQNGLIAVPVLHENQSCFLWLSSGEPIQVPTYLHNKENEDETDLWVETLKFNNDESMKGMVLHIDQDTCEAKLYRVGNNMGDHIDGPVILVLRQYKDASFVSLVEELGPVFASKTDSVSFKLALDDLIVLVPPKLTKLYKDVFDLVGIFGEYAVEDPFKSFNDVRCYMQSALGNPLTLLAVQVK